MIQAVRGLQWLSRLIGACELTLGLVIWFVGVSSVNLHIGLGVVLTLILVIVSGIALSSKESRVLGVIGIVYAFVLPAFGLVQMGLLIGSLHWLVQALHLLIGIGSLALIHMIGGRYVSLKRPPREASPDQVAAPQVAVSEEA